MRLGGRMKVIFLGVGEAFDETLVNNSHIIHSDTKLLLDCGYAIPRHLWKHYPEANFIDAVYLSHAHADHYLGLPVLLARLWEDGRTKPLEVIAQSRVIKKFLTVINYAYKGLLDDMPFPVNFVGVSKESKVRLNELTLSFAQSKHIERNFAVRVEGGGKVICYSGDGVQTRATRDLYRDADLLIHEAYDIEEEVYTHACLKNVIPMCEEVKVKTLALTHVRRDVRRDRALIFSSIEKYARRVRVLLPEQLDEFVLD